MIRICVQDDSQSGEEEATQADPHCGSGPRYAHGLAAMRIVRARSFVRAGHGTSRSRRRSQRSERLNANSYEAVRKSFPVPAIPANQNHYCWMGFMNPTDAPEGP
jgi:hypothetical protein